MASGGPRPGSGRKVGFKLTETHREFLQRKRDAERSYHNKVIKETNRIYEAQLRLGKGCNFLYRVDTDDKGKKQKPVLVNSQKEIELYLAGDVEDMEAYHYITTERPDNRALDSMLDRTYGKAVQKTEVSGPEGGVIEITGIQMVVPNGKKKDD